MFDVSVKLSDKNVPWPTKVPPLSGVDAGAGVLAAATIATSAAKTITNFMLVN